MCDCDSEQWKAQSCLRLDAEVPGLWSVSNLHAASLNLWTAFEMYSGQNCQALMDELVSFTVEPVIEISRMVQMLQVPDELAEDVSAVLKTYVSRAAFAGSGTTLTPLPRHKDAHMFLLEAGAIQKKMDVPSSTPEFQLSQQFVPCAQELQ